MDDAATALDEHSYLTPYTDAVAEFGSGFRSLLWASPKTQRARFDAIAGATDLSGKRLLDVGCGRADLLLHLRDKGISLAEYWGLEAIDTLADAAQRQGARLVKADFVASPRSMFIGCDVLVFSGSLNTLSDDDFYRSLRHAFAAAGEALVFNFLAASTLAGKAYLHWHEPADVARFARGLTDRVAILEDYLRGDCTVCLKK